MNKIGENKDHKKSGAGSMSSEQQQQQHKYFSLFFCSKASYW